MIDCGCTPKKDYIAGSGWAEIHEHPVRGDDTCGTCADFYACEQNVRRRDREQRWLGVFTGEGSLK